MKKSIVAAAILIASTGILSTSCTKEKTLAPTATFEKSTTANKKDVGTAD